MEPRQNYLSEETYFMGVALLASKRSRDPNRQVGACIVNKDKRIVGIGYNGMPLGRDDIFPWGRNEINPLNDKHTYVCHAELNAIAMKTSIDVKDCNMYVTLHPCNECAKMIIQSGINKVYYLSDDKGHKPMFKASKIMFEKTDVKSEQFIPSPDESAIEINFAV